MVGEWKGGEGEEWGDRGCSGCSGCSGIIRDMKWDDFLRWRWHGLLRLVTPLRISPTEVKELQVGGDRGVEASDQPDDSLSKDLRTQPRALYTYGALGRVELK